MRKINALTTSSPPTFMKEGQAYLLNDPGDPHGSVGGPQNSIGSTQAVGFDRYAALYSEYYCGDCLATIHFRRQLNQGADNFLGWVGYYYGDSSTELAAIATKFNVLEATDNVTVGSLYQSLFATPGIVMRRFGINDQEHGLKMQFKYNRRSFFKNNIQNQQFNDVATGIITGSGVGGISPPSEKAYIIPFILLERAQDGNAGTYTETAPGVICEMSLCYHTLWMDLGHSNIDDTASYNVGTS